MTKVVDFFIKTLRPRVQRSFLSSIKKENCKVLDVGCGNKSSIFIKTAKPSSVVFGIDIDESKELYEQYIVTQPEMFHQSIQEIEENFDIIISNHNIEHCNNPESTFSAMVDRATLGGHLYIATPSVRSVNFPSRGGGLNFYDDDTHRYPVDMMKLFNSESDRLECVFYSKSCRPIFWSFFGWVVEFISKKKGKIMLGTWDYYGFEQVMWIKKTSP